MLRKDIVRRSTGTGGTADPEEVRRFDALAEEWRKPDGKFKVVHSFNAARVGLVISALRPGGQVGPGAPLAGVRIADVGCGAGLVSEALARAGADVIAIDASETSIAIARRHAQTAELDIDYRCALPEQLADQGLQFDAVVCLEVIEHVSDVPTFLRTIAALTRPGGRLVLGTLNRTALSWVLAIVAAEYLLRGLPRGTHSWSGFIRPDEIAAIVNPPGCRETARHGIVFDPLRWR